MHNTERPPIDRTTLRALDPHLPLLAATAAVEIDNLLRVEGATETKLEALPRIAEMIASFDPKGRDIAGTRTMFDPISDAIISQAYSATLHKDAASLSELKQAAKKLYDSIHQEGDIHPDSALLVEFRDFLLTLSSYASTKRQSALGERPRPPYQR